MVELEGDDEAEGMSRRKFMKYAMAAGVAGLGGATVATFKSVLPGVGAVKGELRKTFQYVRPSNPTLPWWWESRIHQTVRPEHFQEWQGATVWWRGRYDETGSLIPNTGFPAIAIRVPPDTINAPDDFDDYLETEGIVAFIDKCVHLCCNPSWHLNPIAESDRPTVPVPELDAAGQDPIFCICHLSQYDPTNLVWNKHPDGTKYVGAKFVHGPADRALPSIPVRTEGGELVGDSDNPKWSLAWYNHCR